MNRFNMISQQLTLNEMISNLYRLRDERRIQSCTPRRLNEEASGKSLISALQNLTVEELSSLGLDQSEIEFLKGKNDSKN